MMHSLAGSEGGLQIIPSCIKSQMYMLFQPNQVADMKKPTI